MNEGNVQSLSKGTDPGSALHQPGMFGGMPAPVDAVQATEELVFLDTGQEQAQKFIRAMSNPNANDILQHLKESGPLRLSDIAEHLGMSLNATKYHVENMMDAGLVEISNTRYSVKGRKVKMYRMKNQIFIVAPSITDRKQILSAVLKYGSFMGIYAVLAISFLAFIPLVTIAESIPLSGSLQPGISSAGAAILPADVSGGVVALIMAAVITLLVMVMFEVMEYWRRRNRPAGF